MALFRLPDECLVFILSLVRSHTAVCTVCMRWRRLAHHRFLVLRLGHDSTSEAPDEEPDFGELTDEFLGLLHTPRLHSVKLSLGSGLPTAAQATVLRKLVPVGRLPWEELEISGGGYCADATDLSALAGRLLPVRGLRRLRVALPPQMFVSAGDLRGLLQGASGCAELRFLSLDVRLFGLRQGF
eukprot:RCo035203